MATGTNYESTLEPIVQKWMGTIEMCASAKQPYKAVADLCNKFYMGMSGFMWDPTFKRDYFKGANIANPKFGVTINKAFELVAIFGPYLYWKYPNRRVQRYDRTPLYPELLGDPNDPVTQQMFEVLQYQMQSDERESEMRNGVMQQYLNYAQREQPGGGLEFHSMLSITEALIRGRGCLWTEHYKFPGSKRTLTRSVFDTVDNLLIDPDCTDPTLTDAQFIIRRHSNTTRDVEAMFKLKPGSLLGKGTYETNISQGSKTARQAKSDRQNKQALDMMVWYEIFSRCGVGTRLCGTRQLPMEDHFDDVVGDYCRLCVAPNVPYFLNAPPEVFDKADNEGVKKMFDWPVPYWQDNRWPLSPLDFYHNTKSCWPVPPLAPGLGELMCINILAAAVTSQTFDSARQVIGYLKHATADLEKALTGVDSTVLVPLTDMNKTVAECIQYLQKPEINGDVWKTIDWLSLMFDKRVGLSELLYSMNPGGAQSRSAEDAKIKQANASVRPDYMAQQVAKQQTEVAEKEKMAAYWHVKAKDISTLLGRAGALAWEKYIEEEDPEIVFREMRCTVEASDVKKPNKERETANMQALSQFMLAELSEHANVTGDTTPLNNFIRDFGDAIEVDTSEWMMGERVPMPPDPEMVQLEKDKLTLEGEKLKADAMKAQADAEGSMREAENAERMMQIEAEGKQMELQFDAIKGQQQMELEREKAAQKIRLEQAQTASKIQVSEAQAATQIQLQQAQGAQQMRQAEETHQQQKQQGAVQFAQDLTQSRMAHAQKMTQAGDKARMDAKKKKAAAKK